MIVIRAEQVEVMQEASRRRLAEKLFTFLRLHCASLCSHLGDEALRSFIEEGLARGGEHGYEVEKDLSRYVSLELLLGRDFHGSQGPIWVREALARLGNPSAAEGPSRRMMALWAEAELRHGKEGAAATEYVRE